MSGVVPALMFQGTGSDVGKSVLVAGLARAFANRGLRVVPFKPQNMSNNAAVTADGGEIGRAQALQARAARIAPSTDMNPVLLKPQSDVGAQIVVHGRVWGRAQARDYQGLKPQLRAAVDDSFARLGDGADLILVEGAGSPAEINLRANDIANMGFALPHRLPVVLIGDIDRGGVIASLVGTHAVLTEAERALVKGYIINKFRGDQTLFDDGLSAITQRTGWPALGVVPYLRETARLPAEDAMQLEAAGARPAGGIVVAVPVLSRIANFDDLDPLAQEPGVSVRFVRAGEPLPAEAAAVVLPGSKATLADLAFFRAQGWDIDLAAHVRRGGRVLGLCGGYQMLGRTVADPDGIEGPPGAAPGLGLLDIDTVLAGDKTVRPATGQAGGIPVAGYEIHLGRTSGPDCTRPLVMLETGPDGAVSADGRIAGCYLHGLFTGDPFRAHWLRGLGAAGSGLIYEKSVDDALDAIAAALAERLDLDRLLAIARSRPQT